jgi:hypothetical protein
MHNKIYSYTDFINENNEFNYNERRESIINSIEKHKKSLKTAKDRKNKYLEELNILKIKIDNLNLEKLELQKELNLMQEKRKSTI